jgi:hypothetical protein
MEQTAAQSPKRSYHEAREIVFSRNTSRLAPKIPVIESWPPPRNTYRWSKEFLEARKKRLAGDTAREATSDEVKERARQLKETLAEVLIENRLLKKAFSGMGRTLHEVFRIRKVRDHRTGGTVVALDPSNTGADRDPEIDVLVHSGQQAPKSPIKRRSRAELAMPLGGIAEILGR